MVDPVDPFDLNDRRLEELGGEYGALLREGAQTLDALSGMDSLSAALTALGKMDERALKPVVVAALYM
jgi:hypothetical protein